MKNKSLSEKAFPAGLFILAAVMLFNPNINILDILPDFIGYLIIAKLLVHAARRVPFFEEARLGCFKLALLSFAKYPAFLLMIMIRGKNTLDNDVITLFSFTFAVIEAILAIGTINNLFAGISYLGQRTGAKAVIGENPKADALRTMTLAFAVLKCVLYALPEFLLLTTMVDAGSPTSLMPESRYYPVVLLFCQVVGYAVGAAWLAFCARYLRRLGRSGEFYPAVMQLTDEEREGNIARKIKKDRLLFALKLLPFAVLISFDFTLDKYGGANILPHSIIGFLLLAVSFKLSLKKNALTLATLILGAVYSVFSTAVWFFEIDYHETYSHIEIMLYDEADSMFYTYAALSVIEAVLLVAYLLLFTLTLFRFIRTHTGKTPRGVIDPLAEGEEESNYSVYDGRYHRSLKIKALIFFAIGLVSTLSKLLHVFTDRVRAFADGSLIPTVAPWLGSLIVGLSVIWAIYTLYFTNILSEDFKMKYSEGNVHSKVTESQYF